MAFKLIKVVLVVGIIAVIAASIPDVKRYIELRNM
jgi:Tfp pilus assembly major pilin PilA